MGFLSRFTNLFKKKSGEAETAEAKESEEGKAQAEAEVAAQANAAESAPVSEAKPQAAAAEEKKPAEEKAESAPEPSPKRSSRLIDDSIRESGSTAAKETDAE